MIAEQTKTGTKQESLNLPTLALGMKKDRRQQVSNLGFLEVDKSLASLIAKSLSV